MYFHDKKSNTNIDDDFDNKQNILSSILSFISKYKKIIIISVVVFILLILMILLFSNRNITLTATKYLELNGEEIVTIYQDSDYIEPGYRAYNSKDEDLKSEVLIETNLNNKVIGEYEIMYTLGDITRIRIVNVITKPKEYTYIHLKSFEKGTTDVYLKVGEKYEEPGYMVFSSTGTDLTNNVNISGEVDTSKKGTYKLVYSVLDSSGVTINAIRTIIVLDSDINLSLSTSSYTNKDVTINIEVVDEYFDYLILPDSTRINESKYSYTATENGKYTFKTTNKKGMSKESSIEVKNIDKTAPTGSCSGSYKEGISSINVTAKDNIGISKYVINNNSYTNNKITINGELKTVNIVIYDKANNTKNISCNLSNKNEPTYKDDPIYKQEKYHDNSINGIRFILYNQHDSRWGDSLCRGTSTFTEAGCVATSTAVVLSSYDTSFQPVDVPVKYRNEWPTKTINDLANGAYSCIMKWGIDVRDLLLEGKVIIIEVRGKEYGATSKFTTVSHYMSLLDYDKENDRIFVGNGASDYGYGLNGWFSSSDVLNSVYSVHICTPSDELLKKYK